MPLPEDEDEDEDGVEVEVEVEDEDGDEDEVEVEDEDLRPIAEGWREGCSHGVSAKGVQVGAAVAKVAGQSVRTGISLNASCKIATFPRVYTKFNHAYKKVPGRLI